MQQPSATFISGDSDDTARAPRVASLDAINDPGNRSANGASETGSGIRPGEPVDIGFDIYDPAEIGTDRPAVTGTDTGTKYTKTGTLDGRTRAARAARQTKISNPLGDTVSLTELLLSLHVMGATILSTPEIELEKEEAEKLSKAMAEVAKHYAIQFDPKKVAIFNLAVVAGGIYGSRIIAYRLRRGNERKNKLSVMPGKQDAETPRGEIKTDVKVNGSPPHPSMMAPSALWKQSGEDLLGE